MMLVATGQWPLVLLNHIHNHSPRIPKYSIGARSTVTLLIEVSGYLEVYGMSR